MPSTASCNKNQYKAHPGPHSERRQPEESVLYQVVREHWPEFQEHAEDPCCLGRRMMDTAVHLAETAY